ncbi:MAG: S-layer homology domain-containing protein [Oscillospiraceae bacterium]|jgi:hypothetical protein|nr:S-layer homology domain-containing protein [Oscillospiraceae bacterium]
MKKLSLSLAIIMLLCLLPVSGAYAAGTDKENDPDYAIVYESYDAIDKEDWERWLGTFTDFYQRTNSSDLFIKDEQAKAEHRGIFDVISCKVVDVYEFDLSDEDVYDMLMAHSHMYNTAFYEGFPETRVVMALVDMEVYEENMFTHNGLNIFMEYLFLDDGEWKYGGSSVCDVVPIEYAYPEDERSPELKKAIELIHLKYDFSIWANMDGKILDILYRDEFRPFGNFQEVRTYSDGQFSDVDETAWYGSQGQQAIKKAYEMGIITGNGDGTFNPAGTLTVAQALKMAAVVHNTYNGGGELIQGSPWYKVYVDYAISNEIIKADSFTDYEREITRAEMAMVFAKALPSEALPGINRTGTIPDVAETAQYYEEIFSLYEAGVLIGNDESGTFRPNDKIIRAEAAALVVRLANPYERIYVFYSV